MLYWLHLYFDINILGYITIRAGIAFFLGLTLTLFLMPKFIKWAKSSSSVQPINNWAPEAHQLKSKTPTMGGIVFIIATIIASFLTVKLNNIYVIGALTTIITFSLIGLQDDMAKIKNRLNTAGLSAKAKLFAQILSAGGVAAFLYIFAEFDTDLYLPFMKTPIFDMGIFAMLFWIVVIVSTSNAVNLTDGLDGLATVPSIAALSSLSLIVYATGNSIFSEYLLIPHFNVGEVVIIASALIGSLAGFLWYNCHPAEIFMGDSGSLTLGAFIAYMAIISKVEILLVLIGLIFVIETLSVILQVGSFKLRKKRIFLMAPIHHHFEMKKWSENKIIVRFWIIAIISNLIAIITLKIR
ncbi:phospho-N-acetylmuramoyl-pentapeptide-transferase [Sulfurimonas sp. HSL-1716]|uniref:phospho-N-acetylmuramoyl-pentapeptide- transferase n=1 Tax=Hydrocurvibacter sulfurireducens TaxID=3131937 RepID=UPI0031F9BAC5